MWADLVNGTLTSQYLPGDKVDQLFARIDQNGTTLTPNWYVTDNQGSVRDMLDSNGVVKDSVTYGAFGNIISETNATPRGRDGYTGRPSDATGLQYNDGRYYDPNTARWIAQDPDGFNAGDSNLYRYVKNAPEVATDPSGLQPPFGQGGYGGLGGQGGTGQGFGGSGGYGGSGGQPPFSGQGGYGGLK